MFRNEILDCYLLNKELIFSHVLVLQRAHLSVETPGGRQFIEKIQSQWILGFMFFPLSSDSKRLHICVNLF